MNSDGHHMAMPHGRTGSPAAWRTALERSGLAPDAIDYYNAHGTSTIVNDRVETEVLKDVFGDHAAEAARSARSRGRSATAWAPPRRSRRPSASVPLLEQMHPAHDQPSCPTPSSTSTTCPATARAGAARDCHERLVRIRRHE